MKQIAIAIQQRVPFDIYYLCVYSNENMSMIAFGVFR